MVEREVLVHYRRTWTWHTFEANRTLFLPVGYLLYGLKATLVFSEAEGMEGENRRKREALYIGY